MGFRVHTLVPQGCQNREKGAGVGVYQELVEQGESGSERLVRVEQCAERAIVTLDEPDRLNAALSARMVIQLATEEFAEPNCFTTGWFQDAVRGLLEDRA
jgi:hypothetical protein